ncbi:MAG TPA: DNA polymerase I [Bacteroidales bacterium]|nr:DNA polymerase I [Bacteroidales bacterium]
MKNKIFFLDAYALIFRAYYAFIKNPRINSKGFNTSAIFGFVNTLEEVLNKEKPSHIGVAFDPSGPNFRHEMFPQYKANREATPEDIKKSVPYIKQILNAYKIPVIEVPGYEADDVIGTLATLFANDDSVVYMMTPDKDYTQLVDENILIYKPSRAGNIAEIIGVKEVKEKYGISSPENVKDILALWGDASDNVPGVPGIGEKTAAKLIERFGDIDQIYNNIHKLVGKQKEALEKNKEQLYLSKQLVTIKRDIQLDISLEQLLLEKPDFTKLDEIFSELEFKTLSTRIIGNKNLFENSGNHNESQVKAVSNQQFDLFNKSVTTELINSQVDDQNSFSKSEINYKLIETQTETEQLIKLLNQYPEICIDTETTSLDTFEAEIIGLSIAVKEKEAFYVLMPDAAQEIQRLLMLFQPILNDPNKLIIGQNLKYDLSVLRNYDITVKAKQFDTMIAHYLLEPEQKHNLDFLSSKYLDYKMIPIESLIGEKGKNQKNMKSIDVNLIADYSCEDADITLRLKNIFAGELKKSGLENLFYDIEMPLVNVLIDMERAGVCIDSETITKYSVSLKEELINIENKIFELAGETFNIASPKQLGIILFEKLKIINNPKKTKTHQYSTGEEELVRLTEKHPIINEILEYRSVNKLINTYVDVLPGLVNRKTSKIHTSFNQTVTSTGRLSSNNPNLQNIPIREDRGREIRRSFISSGKDYVFFSADYSQIELRLMAHMSQDINMLDAFNKFSLDIHTATAAKIFKVPESEVSREMRSKAKTANFGIIYGISAFGLGQRLNIPVKEAKILIDNYFETFPGVKLFIDKCIATAREKEYVETLFGRYRNLPDINSKNAVVRGFAERNAINAPIQGSAADIIKLAMVNIARRFEEENIKSKMILQVHDELNFDVYKPELEKVNQAVTEEMQNVLKLSVPLIVETGTGTNWLDAH